MRLVFASAAALTFAYVPTAIAYLLAAALFAAAAITELEYLP